MAKIDLLNQGFKSVAERILEVKKYDPSQLLTFGISFLDRALRGIFPDDLILFGAMPGAGKTQLAVNIGLINSNLGKRVHLFALEASKNEIESRMLYSLVAQEYYKSLVRPILTRELNYEDWLIGYFGDKLEYFEDVAKNEILKRENFNTFYRDDEKFTEKTLDNMANTYAGETDLLIVDHVHYFDFIGDDENKALHSIIKTARKIVLDIKKPMIMIAHLRKRDKFTELVPGMYEFHGSSNLTKIATRVITMAPGGPTENDPLKFYTNIRVSKNRFNSSVSNYIGQTLFDIRTNEYGDWTIGKLSKDGKEFQPLAQWEEPYWAKPDRNIL